MRSKYGNMKLVHIKRFFKDLYLKEILRSISMFLAHILKHTKLVIQWVI